MTWMGHKRMEETMRYVHIAGAHMRETPSMVLAAAEGEFDPDKRVLKMLGARVMVPVVMSAATSFRQTDGIKCEAHDKVVGF